LGGRRDVAILILSKVASITSRLDAHRCHRRKAYLAERRGIVIEKKTKRQAIEEKIILKAQEDAGFKQQLMSNPKAAIQEVLGLEVPPTIDVQVLEESPTRLYLVLPVDPDSVELPDEMLDKVAGGPCATMCGGC
jgi:hypothetical protein